MSDADYYADWDQLIELHRGALITYLNSATTPARTASADHKKAVSR